MKWLKSLIVLGALVCGAAHAFAPQAGSWVIPSEINGQPGRGFVVDVQNGLFGMQMYGYQSNGQPTFYLAVGPLVNNAVTAPMYSYVGGRYLGSGPRSGTTSGSPGNVSVRFTSSTAGFITLPGEPEVAFSRYEFGYTPGDPNNLMGTWVFTGINTLGGLSYLDTPALTTNVGPVLTGGTGMVMNSSKTMGCEQLPPTVTGDTEWITLCFVGPLNILSFPTAVTRTYQFTWAANEGGGGMFNGSGTTNQGVVLVRKIIDANGNSVAFVRDLPVDADETAAPVQEDLEAFKQAMNQAAAQMLKRQSD